jgi:hypothetical protein
MLLELQHGQQFTSRTEHARPGLAVYLWTATLLSLLTVSYFLPQALRGRSLGEGEGVTYYLPMRELVAEAWREGRWPLWNPYVYGGMPLLADCQAGAFYPPNLLYLCLEPVPAMNTVLLVGDVIAVFGMVFLLRAYRVSALAAAAGTLVFVFSGFMIAHMCPSSTRRSGSPGFAW